MKKIDEQDLKTEIDEISRNIDRIIKKIGELDPARKEQETENRNEAH